MTNIHKLLAVHMTMAGLHAMLDDIVSEAEGVYCASARPEDKARLNHLLMARSSHIETMRHFAEAGGAEIVPSGQSGPADDLNSDGVAL